MYAYEKEEKSELPIRRLKTLQMRNQGTPVNSSVTQLNKDMEYSQRIVSTVSQMTGKDVAPDIHLNSSVPSSYNALATRQDNRIDIGPGQLKHLGHEVTHVTQGAVQATGEINGAAINDNPALEGHADRVGNAAHAKVSAEMGYNPS